MGLNWVNIGLAFIEGFVLIISPCILPILPIILTGSLTGNKFRPIGIIVGFVFSFTVVILFSKLLIEALHINPNLLRNISYIVLIGLGIVMMSNTLSEKFNLLTQRLSNRANSISTLNKPGFWGGILFGGLIGIIWTPCVGPILAAVIVQALTQATYLQAVLIVLAFAIGVGIPMLLIAIFGRTIISKFKFFRNQSVLFRRILGLLIILGVLLAIYSPNLTLMSASSQETELQSAPMSLTKGLIHFYPAPAIAGIDAWINSPPLNLNDLKGKVVLIDFWTYSCINCIRTLGHLKNWYAQYRDQGLVIIGVHSPEFQFEHDLNNVKSAVKKLGILYPVALDNQFVTWQNFHNQYWPAHYLINKEGDVVYQHAGEGEYNITENNIRYLLGLTKPVTAKVPEVSYSARQTPETYLGYARAENFVHPTSVVVKNKPAVYSYPQDLPESKWALRGKWRIDSDKIVAEEAGAAIKLHFYAGKVYAVMGVIDKPIKVQVTYNDKQSQILVTSNQLYTLIELKQEVAGVLELITTEPGLEIYTFTFGE